MSLKKGCFQKQGQARLHCEMLGELYLSLEVRFKQTDMKHNSIAERPL